MTSKGPGHNRQIIED